MRHLTLVAVLGALALVPAGASAATANPYLLEQASATPGADQGSNANYRSNIVSVTPAAPGLQVQVLAFADRLQLVNHTGRTVTIYGYQGEPYARLLPDGEVQLNEHSPAVFLNTSFFGGGTPPPGQNPNLPPQWTTIYKTGSFQWHDHRIHWASPTTPPQVKDKDKRTLIFNWTLPISVGAERGRIAGQLFWAPSTSGASVGAYVALAVIALLGISLVLFVRARRRRAGPDGPPGAPDESASDAGTTTPARREAW
jgi:hypothetical protein